jgi:hypothetical protein
VKAVSAFLAVVAILFYAVWLSEIVPALIAGGIPASAAEAGTPTNAIHVLDMAWILPGMLLTAVWLWRERAIGYALAGALLTFMPLLASAIVAMTVAMSLHGQPAAGGMAAVFGVLLAISLGMAIWHMGGMAET